MEVRVLCEAILCLQSKKLKSLGVCCGFVCVSFTSFNLVAPKNGYVYMYIYVSNESPVNVFFESLQVVHTRGPILEETHYYPFGLSMAGISSKVLKTNYAENKYKFNKGS